MPILPETIMPLVRPFRPLFHPSTWEKGQTLLSGSILAVGKRTVTSALRVMGLSQERQFAKYHHVLNRATWSPYQAALILLRLLLAYLDTGEGPLVFGLDETIERRWGAQISARGIYRDAVRSSKSHFVKTSGLRWLCVMWLSAIPWAQRVWALPVLTLLAPSEGYYETRVRSHKKLTDWARQVIKQLRRWLPRRQLVVVADYSYAALDLLHACQQLAQPVAMVTRLRLDAALYDPAPPYPGVGRPAKKGARRPTLERVLDNAQTVWDTIRVPWYDGQVRTLEIVSDTAVWYHSGKPVVPLRWVLVRDPQGTYEPVGLLSTDPDLAPSQIVSWFVHRWRLEVTFEEVRTHLGVETQRQWSDKAIARTTPLLLGLFSWITLAAHLLVQDQHVTVRTAAWYAKGRPTFSDAISWVRYRLWLPLPTFSMSPVSGDILKVPRPLFDRLVDTVCYAA
jgi:hypothetical protein